MAAYVPPANNAVNFNNTGGAYTPPLYNAVYFDVPVLVNNVSLPVAVAIALAGVAPAFSHLKVLTLPAAVSIALAGVAPSRIGIGGRVVALPAAKQITFAGVAPSISGAVSLRDSVRPHRTLGGGPAREGTLGYSHRMVLGGLMREGGGGAHRSVIGGMEREGGSAFQQYRFVTLPTARQIVFAGVPPVFVQRFVDGGSGHVLFFVPFTGNVSTDIGPQHLGDGTNSGASMTGDKLVLSGDTQQKIEWYDTRLGTPTATGWTFECFMTYTSSTNTSDPGLDFYYGIYNPMTDALLERFFIAAYSNNGTLQLDLSGFGVEAYSSAGVLNSSRQHVAIVQPTASSDVLVYVNGVRIFNWVTGAGPVVGGKGLIRVGREASAAGEPISATMDEIRFCNIPLYSGASFTPPVMLASE